MNGLGLNPNGVRWACGSNATLLRNAESGISGEAPALHTRRITLYAEPNPLSEQTRISYVLPRAGHVRLAIYDAAGKLETMLVDGFLPAGRHAATWQVSSARGVYFCELDGIGGQARLKLVRSHE